MGEFPGGPVVRGSKFPCKGLRFNPWLGTNILHASPCSQNNNNFKKFFNSLLWSSKPTLACFRYILPLDLSTSHTGHHLKNSWSLWFACYSYFTDFLPHFIWVPTQMSFPQRSFPRSTPHPPPITASRIAVLQWRNCVQLCDPRDWSMAGFSVLHYLPEFPQIHAAFLTDSKNFASFFPRTFITT